MAPDERSLFSDATLLLLANTIGSGVGFLFHLVVARLGGAEIYADFGVLLSILICVSIVSVAIQTYVAEASVKFAAQGGVVSEALGGYLRLAIGLGIVLSVCVAVLADHIALFFQMAQIWAVWLLAFTFIPLFTVSVLRGVLQGARRFRSIAFMRVAEPGLQIALGTVSVLAGYGAGGAFLGTSGGIILSLIICIYLLRPSLSGRQMSLESSAGNYRYFAQILVVLLLVNLQLNMDILFVKHNFSSTTASHYIAASFTGRFLMMSAFAIGTALFPRVVAIRDAQSTERPRTEVTMRAMLYFIVIALSCLLVTAVWSKQIVLLLFGVEYAETAMILTTVLLANSLIGVAYLAALHQLSSRSNFCWLPFFFGTLVLFVLLSWGAATIQDVAQLLFVSSGLVFALALFQLWRFGRAKQDV